MSNLLYIKANIKQEGESRTFQVSDFFIEEYLRFHPEDKVSILDLYQEGIDFLRPNDLEAMSKGKEENPDASNIKYATQFAKADKYVFAAPMWNLSFPAIMKAYIDYISVPGITFQYTEQGPKGLLDHKKALHVVARGGEYGDSPFEMGDRYLRTILQFYGIMDIKTIAIENLDLEQIDVEAKLREGKDKAQLIAKDF